jgi:Ca2+-transporting ATPase
LVQLQRNGVELKVAPEQMQRGDQLRLEEGDRVAADARLTEAVGPC